MAFSSPLHRLAFPGSIVLSIVVGLGCTTPDGPADARAPGASSLAPPVSVPATTPADVGPADDTLIDVEVATVGWDGLTGAPVVMLREIGGTRLLPIWIGLAEAQAIARELHGVALPRPMSHDLMLDLLEETGAILREVRVVALRQGTYYGRLELERADGERRSVDARPSDGLALGLRADARLRVVPKLFEDIPDLRFEAPGAEGQVVRVLGLTVAASEGVVVVRATAGIAADAGVEVGDIVLRVDGERVGEPMDLLDALDGRERAGELELRLRRGDRELTVRLPLDRPRAVRGDEVEV